MTGAGLLVCWLRWQSWLFLRNWMTGRAAGLGLGGETAAGNPILKTIAVVAGRLALPESEDVGKAKADRHERDEKRRQQRSVQHHEQDEEHGDGHADTAYEPPEQAAFE